MRSYAAGFVVGLVVASGLATGGGCDRSSPGATRDEPHHREDRREPASAPTAATIAVTVDGAATTWTEADLASVPRMAGSASDGEARDTWSLRAVVAARVGPSARVASVTGAGIVVPLEPAAWADATRTPILHSTRRGTLKFRWADAAGVWGATIAKDITAMVIVTK